MLRAFGPGCDGSTIDAARQKIPDGASWIDLEEPTREEEALVEKCIGLDIPTQDELSEIEPSSRLYDKNGALYMTVSALAGVTEGEPITTPIAFVLTDRRLVTLRYQTPKPILAFLNHVEREPELVHDSRTAFVRLIDALVDRLADELEGVGREYDEISHHIFARDIEARRIPADKLTALLTRIGWAQSLVTKIRYSTVSTSRALSFLAGSNRLADGDGAVHLAHVRSLMTDAQALSEHASFLSDNLTFLLDASLGLISIEQNAAMKLFSWAAMVFLPPSVVVGFFGMNFHYFPQLDWPGGSYSAIAVMAASAVLPYFYFKRRGWI